MACSRVKIILHLPLPLLMSQKYFRFSVQFYGFERRSLCNVWAARPLRTGTPTEHLCSISVILRISSNTNTLVLMINNPEMCWDFEMFAPYSSVLFCSTNKTWTYQNIQTIYFLLDKIICEAFFIPLIRILLDNLCLPIFFLPCDDSGLFDLW
jgi:hypothetical protein